MGVLEALRKSAGSTDLYECRHCGETLAATVEECPNCNRTEVAHYKLQ